jgi:hypothetical protein
VLRYFISRRKFFERFDESVVGGLAKQLEIDLDLVLAGPEAHGMTAN